VCSCSWCWCCSCSCSCCGVQRQVIVVAFIAALAAAAAAVAVLARLPACPLAHLPATTLPSYCRKGLSRTECMHIFKIPVDKNTSQFAPYCPGGVSRNFLDMGACKSPSSHTGPSISSSSKERGRRSTEEAVEPPAPSTVSRMSIAAEITYEGVRLDG
jgi:hypothetical protein